MSHKKTFTISYAGHRPLKLKLVEDRELKESYEKKRPKGVDLVELANKLDGTKVSAPSITQTRKKRREGASIAEAFHDFGSLPTVLCNKCPYNHSCPYFARYQVCQFVTTFFDSGPRFMHKFIPHIMKYINTKMWFSSVLTEEQTWYDSLSVMTAAYVLLKVIKDQKLPNHIPLYDGKHKDTRYGGRTRNTAMNANTIDLKDRKRRSILGILHISSLDRNSPFELDQNINKQFYWQPFTKTKEINQ